MLVNRILWHIEQGLDDPLTLAQLSQRSGASPYHLIRVFGETMGMSPMAYLRARRLSRAAVALSQGQAVLSAALAAQYASHAAFTRAFSSRFGVLPSVVRQTGTTDNLQLMERQEMDKTQLTDVPAPEFKETKATTIVGLGMDCSFDKIAGIPALWQDFNAREDDVPDIVGPAGFGVCGIANADGKFRYLAGVESRAKGALPAGMERMTLAAGRYAVFIHKGHIAALPRTVYTIWNKSLPDAKLDVREDPNFERYGPNFDPQTGMGGVEIWIPVQDS